MTDPRVPPGSRYEGVPIALFDGPDGVARPFLRRRFIAPPAAFATLTEHVVEAGDRLDLIAARYLDDPQQYWRLCDASGALDPDALLVVGKPVRVTLPEGLPGPRDGR